MKKLLIDTIKHKLELYDFTLWLHCPNAMAFLAVIKPTPRRLFIKSMLLALAEG